MSGILEEMYGELASSFPLVFPLSVNGLVYDFIIIDTNSTENSEITCRFL